MSKQNELVAPNVWRLPGPPGEEPGYIALYVNTTRSIQSSRHFYNVDDAKEFASTGIAP